MNKKSKVVSIFNLILSLVAFAFFGYFAYIFTSLLSIALRQADTNAERLDVIVTMVVMCLPAFISLVNFVMSCISFKYLGRGAEKYRRGFHVAMFVLELVAMASYIAYAIVNATSGLLLVFGVAVAVLYAVFAFIHIADVKKSKKVEDNTQEIQQ